MIRTDAVKLTSMKAFAYRQKLGSGDTGIVIVKPNGKQPGMASISKKTGEPVPARNTNVEDYPIEAFQEAMELTRGLTFRKQGNIKVTKGMFIEPAPEVPEEPVELNERALDAISAHYTDKNGKLSYDLINKELIKFAKSSSIVRKMIRDGCSVKEVREYIVLNKFRNIASNDELTDKEVFKIVEVLDEVAEKGIFKELNEELKKMSAKNKKA